MHNIQFWMPYLVEVPAGVLVELIGLEVANAVDLGVVETLVIVVALRTVAL